MDKRRLKNLILYHLYSSKILVGILLLIMIINLALGVIFKDNEAAIGSIDIASYIFAMFVGFELFKEAFAFSILNGISRKTYYLSNIFSTIFISLCLGIATGIATMISMSYANNNILFTSIYGENVLSLFVWCSVVIYTAINLFHFISLILYRIGKKVKYTIIIVLALLVPFMVLLNNVISDFTTSIQKFFLLFLGVTSNGENIIVNAYLSSLMLLVFTIFITAISWLFLRRIEAK